MIEVVMLRACCVLLLVSLPLPPSLFPAASSKPLSSPSSLRPPPSPPLINHPSTLSPVILFQSSPAHPGVPQNVYVRPWPSSTLANPKSPSLTKPCLWRLFCCHGVASMMLRLMRVGRVCVDVGWRATSTPPRRPQAQAGLKRPPATNFPLITSIITTTPLVIPIKALSLSPSLPPSLPIGSLSALPPSP